MGLQATATKRKIVELEEDTERGCTDATTNSCPTEEDNSQQGSPPKISKLNDVDDDVDEKKNQQSEIIEQNAEQHHNDVKQSQVVEATKISEAPVTEMVKPEELRLSNGSSSDHPEVEKQSLKPATNGIITQTLSPIVGQLVTPAPIVEDSIAKLEQVAVPGEILPPWSSTSSSNANNSEPPIIVDSISRLQAVAVPGETWGSDSTRSALATTLLTAEDLCDEDDDDFDDDFDDDDPTIIPSYLPQRYHHCQPTHRPGAYGNGYTAKLPMHHHHHPPSTHHYYTESYPQAPPPSSNCSRSQVYGNGSNNNTHNRAYNWANSGGNSLYYGHPIPESSSAGQHQQQAPPQPHPQQASQQTIRCAENGKSYLELGSATPTPPPIQSAGPSPYLLGHHHHHPMGRPHHPSSSNNNSINTPSNNTVMKRCCDGRTSNWCNSNNRQCYKDRRLSMLNLSMFKLSRFRQVSEQSLYRSVLICNTLKYIEREIEIESKEAARQQHQQHQQQQQQQQQQHHSQMMHQQHQQQQLSHHSPHHSSMHGHHNSEQYHHHYRSSNGSQFAHHHHQNSQLPPPNHALHPSGQPSHFSSQSMDGLYEETSSNSFPIQPSFMNHSRANTLTPIPVIPFSDSLPPYDHHPLRDSNGRATPFPTTSTSSSVNSTSPNSSPSNSISDSDSGFGDEDCTRPINWGSVLSLSSQSALDPLSASDLFATTATTPLTPITPVQILTSTTVASLPPSNVASGSSMTSAHLKPVQREDVSVSDGSSSSEDNCDDSESTTTHLLSIGSSNSGTISSTASNIICGNLITTTATSFSFPSSGSTTTMSSSGTGHWDYSLLDMDLGLGPELTELLPSWKLTPLSADDILRSVPPPMEPSRVVHESEMDSAFTHIMVGS